MPLKKEPCGHDHLHRQDQRDSQRETAVFGLVMEEAHPQQGADTAAEDGGEKQSSFGDPPRMRSGAVLVKAEESEGQQIDEDEVAENTVNHGKISF